MKRFKCGQIRVNVRGLTNVIRGGCVASVEGDVSEMKDAGKPLHVPVMAKEVLKALEPKDDQVFVDMTFGAGGHTRSILAEAENVTVYALDRDPVAHDLAQRMAVKYGGRLVPLLGRFSQLPELLQSRGVVESSVDAILIDAGCSSMQFDTPARGFSLSADGPLDMRMDGNRYPDQPTVADVLATLDEDALARVLKSYGDEKQARLIARAVVEARYLFLPITTTKELAQIVASAVGSEIRRDKLQRRSHVATKTFQALRIFVSNELNELSYGIQVANRYLRINGLLAALTFHSLEDRLVKRHFMGIDLDEPVSSSLAQKYRNAAAWHDPEAIESVQQSRTWVPLVRGVIAPSEAEVKSNPRCRSAKLRVACKKITHSATKLGRSLHIIC